MNERNLTQKIKQDFDLLASLDRDEWNHNNHYHDFLLKQLPKHSQKVLDLGCGVGNFSRLLAQKSDRVFAVDLSPKSIEVAQERSHRFNNIDYQVADVCKLEFSQNSFDAIASIATVHHLSVEKLLPKLQSALKPGGILLILDLLECQGIQDTLSDCVAVPLNWWFLKIKNRHIQPNPEAIAAIREHQRTDRYLTLSQAKDIYAGCLAGAKIRRHLFWRYSVVWQKPQN